MNAKKCKAIRSRLKSEGVDVKEDSYIDHKDHDRFGRDRIRHLKVAPSQLHSCGRLIYKKFKKADA